MKTFISTLALAICTTNINAQSLQHAYRDFLRVGVSVNQWQVKAKKKIKKKIDRKSTRLNSSH